MFTMFHRGIIFAPARRLVAFAAMVESLLRGLRIGFVTMPDFQSRLLKRPAKRKG